MRILFVHQGFPDQYEKLARHLAAQPGNQVAAIGEASSSTRNPWPPGVGRILYELRVDRFDADSSLRGLGLMEARDLTYQRRGMAAAQSAKSAGLDPDVILAPSGTGEAIFLKDAFPRSKLILYCEFFHRFSNVVGFDPAFPARPLDKFFIRMVGNMQLACLEAGDSGTSPTCWQRGQFPATYQHKISVAHEGIDTDIIRPDDKAVFRVPSSGITFSKNDEVVSYVARSLEPFRGFHTFMRALPEIQRRRPAAHVVIAGNEVPTYSPAPLEGQTYKSLMLRELGDVLDTSRVHFTGHISHEEFVRLLQVSSAHIYLTYPYTLSWSLTEAMSAGCLVIGSRTGPVQEVITDGGNGWLVDFFSPEALADRVAGVLRDRREMQQIREAARVTAVERYDFKRVCLAQHLKLINDTLG